MGPMWSFLLMFESRIERHSSYGIEILNGYMYSMGGRIINRPSGLGRHTYDQCKFYTFPRIGSVAIFSKQTLPQLTLGHEWDNSIHVSSTVWRISHTFPSCINTHPKPMPEASLYKVYSFPEVDCINTGASTSIPFNSSKLL